MAPAIDGYKAMMADAMRSESQSPVSVSSITNWHERRITSDVEMFKHSPHFALSHNQLKEVATQIRQMLIFAFPDAKVWVTGSCPAGLDLPSSDVDVTAEIPSLDGNPGKLSAISNALQKSAHFRAAFKVLRIVGGRVPLLALIHRATDIKIDITLDNDAPKRNTQLLTWYGQCDARFVPLCRAVKYICSMTGVMGGAEGRLNSFSISMMVIHYLQAGVTPAVLPKLQVIFPELNGEIKIHEDESKRRNIGEELRQQGWASKNEDSLGALYIGFFKYFKTFDFENRIISIKRGTSLKLITDRKGKPIAAQPRGMYIVVEDPFMETPFNCARTVRHGETFERIMEEIGRHYNSIKKYKTIFYLDSIRREAMEKEGMERDLMDFNVINRYRGNDFWARRAQHPEEYWEKKKLEYIIGRPWPEQCGNYML